MTKLQRKRARLETVQTTNNLTYDNPCMHAISWSTQQNPETSWMRNMSVTFQNPRKQLVVSAVQAQAD